MKKQIMFLLFTFLAIGALATTIYVPEDYATIQEGINASEDGDEIIVSPGTYVENINFAGKAVILGSLFYTTQNTSYISQTIIDGNQDGSVVTFENEEDSTSVLTGFTITNGHINFGDMGGGIYCMYSSPNLANLTITGNSSDYGGGGIFCESSSPSLTNVTITGNFSNFGGGILCSASNPILEKVTITNNSVWDFGGGICCGTNSSPSFVNVTITGNSAVEDGGGIWCGDNSSPSLVNCISWNNSPQEVEFYNYETPNTITIAYSDIDGGLEGIESNNNGIVNWLDGNINADPLFVDALVGDYHLTEGSPCIDAGTNYFEYEGIVLVDLSEDEYYGIAPDMGAYEYRNVNTEELKIENVKLKINTYPNPFNPETNISFELFEAGNVLLEIYNIKGQKVTTLVNEPYLAGSHKVTWNAFDQSSGIYLLRFNTADKSEMKKLMLLK
ncbi:MAG: T9SS type A sorting domain-containing protein [Candidatus Cloacimonetes bacterium]|nr:T9SS type A sorting domain-containing protein [Candidatus Cloacimonadota bacterium]